MRHSQRYDILLADQAEQGGQIGLTLLAWWFEPATQTPDDAASAERMKEFHIGWLVTFHYILRFQADNLLCNCM